MEPHNQLPLSVTGTGSTPLGTHLVDEDPMAVIDRPQTAFVRELASHLGVSETWVLDHIIYTYAERYGLEPPGDVDDPMEEEE